MSKSLNRRRKMLLEELQEVEAQLEQEAREKELKYYVKVVCPNCHGTGEITQGGADIMSDPPYVIPCYDCGDRGWLWAREWTGKKYVDLEYNEVPEGW